MTLNITLMTPAVIYQSADFRLTDPITGPIMPSRSPKLVTFTYESWMGFVTYTGLGEWQSKDISEHVAEWVEGFPELSMDQLAKRLRKQITRIIKAIGRTKNTWRPHTFTLVGFNNNEAPNVYMISNFEDCYGHRWATRDNFTISNRQLRAGEGAIVFVTGWSKAVPDSDRRQLQMLAARYPGDGGRIRRKIESLNRAAAPKSADRISADCAVFSFRADGMGACQLNRDAAEAPWQFPQITFGTNISRSLADTMRSIGINPEAIHFRMIGTASSGRADPASLGLPVCELSVAQADPKSRLVLTEITAADFETAGCNDISDAGYIVGTGRPGIGQYNSVPWRWHGGQIAWLNYSGLALAVNDKGQVVGALQDGGRQRSGLYVDGSFQEFSIYHGEVGAFTGSDIHCNGLNDESVVVGAVRSKAEERGQPTTRPVAFRLGTANQPAVLLDDRYHGVARAINNNGEVLVIVTSDTSKSGNAVWNISDGSLSFIENDGFTEVVILSMTNYGIILGQARTSAGVPFAIIRMPSGRWERLGTSDGWVPADINDEGEVIGWVIVNQTELPWLRLKSGEIVWLPYIREHHTNPSAINNKGQIVGGAGTDHGSHALLWSRSHDA